METDHDKHLFTKHVILLIDLIFLKRSWTKKITFENEYYRGIKEELSFSA